MSSKSESTTRFFAVTLLVSLALGCKESPPPEATAPSSSGGGELHEAARTGATAVIRAAIDRGVDVNALDENGVTALHEAVAFDQRDVVELLIANGADVDARGIYDRTPLHFGLSGVGARSAVLELLISKGADIHAKSDEGWTPEQIPMLKTMTVERRYTWQPSGEVRKSSTRWSRLVRT